MQPIIAPPPPTENQRQAMTTATVKSGFEIQEYQDGKIAGLWISKRGQSLPCVAIYHMDLEGPVIGIYSAKDAPLAVALHTDPSTGEGLIQLAAADGEIVILSGSQVKQLLALLK